MAAAVSCPYCFLAGRCLVHLFIIIIFELELHENEVVVAANDAPRSEISIGLMFYLLLAMIPAVLLLFIL